MKSLFLPVLALGLSHLATATNILLPLYVRPSVVWNDNASNWQSLLSTIRSHRGVRFDVIINDSDGPGTTPDDVNFAAGVGLLNAESNVRTLGYVHTGYGNLSQDAVVTNVTSWAGWKVPPTGIFFDETPNNIDRDGFSYPPEGRIADAEYMRSLAARTRAVPGFGIPAPLVLNAGQALLQQNVEPYFGLPNSTVVVFEGTWATYQGANPIRDNIPAGRAAQSAIIVHTFNGTLAQLEAELRKISAAGVGWTWFAQRVNEPNVFANYTTPPANAENQAGILTGLGA